MSELVNRTRKRTLDATLSSRLAEACSYHTRGIAEITGNYPYLFGRLRLRMIVSEMQMCMANGPSCSTEGQNRGYVQRLPRQRRRDSRQDADSGDRQRDRTDLD
jgi:hypothetical protein